MEHALRPRRHGLHGAALSRPVEDLQLGDDDLLYQGVRLRREHLAVRVLLEDLDARTVHEESVVQDEEVVVEDAQRVTLKPKRFEDDYREGTADQAKSWTLGLER